MSYPFEALKESLSQYGITPVSYFRGLKKKYLGEKN